MTPGQNSARTPRGAMHTVIRSSALKRNVQCFLIQEDERCPTNLFRQDAADAGMGTKNTPPRGNSAATSVPSSSAHTARIREAPGGASKDKSYLAAIRAHQAERKAARSTGLCPQQTPLHLPVRPRPARPAGKATAEGDKCQGWNARCVGSTKHPGR